MSFSVENHLFEIMRNYHFVEERLL